MNKRNSLQKTRWAAALGALLGAALCPAQDPPATSVPTNAVVATNVVAAVERPIFVSVSPLWESLARAPVLFWHDKHTAALRKEGCGVCHPGKPGEYRFTFPVKRDESGGAALTDSIHDACIGCHEQSARAGRKSGPVTCGECHSEKKAYHPAEYAPRQPADYDALRDPYHKDCLACHAPESKPGHAGKLDWKSFHTRERQRVELLWPKVVFDYVIHDKHQKPLEKKCELCHYLAPDLRRKLADEKRQPTSQDWLRQEEPGKSWSQRDQAHGRCINCHLTRAEEKKEAGPTDCKDCHLDRSRAASPRTDVQPPDYGGQKFERILVHIEKARMPGVPFDHKSHIAASRSCGECHHSTLEPCKACHTPEGVKEGDFITLAEAYHDRKSSWSCIGCHEREKAKPSCAGCHHLRDSGLSAASCNTCHSGDLAALDKAVKLPDPSKLMPADGGGEKVLRISILEKEYDAAPVKHNQIARSLTELSNASRLATYFHTDETTICAGCHHVGPTENNGRPPPACVTCHTRRGETDSDVPGLLGAYHQQCLGCHNRMGLPEQKTPRECTGCHKQKTTKP